MEIFSFYSIYGIGGIFSWIYRTIRDLIELITIIYRFAENRIQYKIKYSPERLQALFDWENIVKEDSHGKSVQNNKDCSHSCDAFR